ncbi:hypothetical protein DDF62_02725 [Caulobacter radicis]|uniref:hypothetical protein n=1 Tax=Caulobacter radicis TaxID=2172650 RepID=UPI000D57B696|nr:hypothetical protein [Caulobacter radicis]PVM92086.1 hypothetical protein DDF62_02725 [Caulobacter radicis]
MAALSDLLDVIGFLFVLAACCGPFALYLGWLVAAGRERDHLRIKRDYEGSGRKVLEIAFAGLDFPQRNGAPPWRLYRVSLQRDDGRVEIFRVGVEATLVSDPDLRDDDPERLRAFKAENQRFFLG